MPKFNICFAADVRAYGSVTIEAASMTEASIEASKMLDANFKDERFPIFDPAYDTLDNFELLSVDHATEEAA